MFGRLKLKDAFDEIPMPIATMDKDRVHHGKRCYVSDTPACHSPRILEMAISDKADSAPNATRRASDQESSNLASVIHDRHHAARLAANHVVGADFTDTGNKMSFYAHDFPFVLRELVKGFLFSYTTVFLSRLESLLCEFLGDSGLESH